MKVAVAGGTGLMGSLVVRALRAAGHEPVILSRTVGVDLRRWLDPDPAVRRDPPDRRHEHPHNPQAEVDPFLRS
jgi:uncharacterized protein YbjT (DUF2867 family)